MAVAEVRLATNQTGLKEKGNEHKGQEQTEGSYSRRGI